MTDTKVSWRGGSGFLQLLSRLKCVKRKSGVRLKQAQRWICGRLYKLFTYSVLLANDILKQKEEEDFREHEYNERYSRVVTVEARSTLGIANYLNTYLKCSKRKWPELLRLCTKWSLSIPGYDVLQLNKRFHNGILERCVCSQPAKGLIANPK